MVKVIKSGAKKGFSLVEISVVMAIVGLLLGGVLAGQALLNGQRKNALISKAKELRVAIQQFKLKYGYYAGDFPTATQVWGRADGGSPITANCANPDSDNANPNGTCNGNGDGVYDWTEPARSWQQLRLAGMVSGLYDGVSAYPPIPGITAPTMDGKLNSAFIPRSGIADSTNWEFYEGDYSGAISYGFDDGSSVSGGGPIISGEDAFNIDRKVDDGLPATGSVRAYKSDVFYRPDCPAANAYPVARKDDVCALVFMGEKAN